MNLAAMKPRRSGLHRLLPRNAGGEYLVYQPKPDESFSVELKAGTYRHEWFSPTKGAVTDTGLVEAPDGRQQFRAPFEGDAVLYLKAQ
jgi:hypothetical protein